MTNYPTRKKPGRPRKSKLEANAEEHLKLDAQIITDHGTYLELDISTPFHPDQTMLIDKVDYERLRSMNVGRFIARPATSPTTGLSAAVNTRNKSNGINTSASYVHTLICKGKGYLWHRNLNLLDNRRANLETDIPLQLSSVGQLEKLKDNQALLDKLQKTLTSEPRNPTQGPNATTDLLTGTSTPISTYENKKG